MRIVDRLFAVACFTAMLVPLASAQAQEATAEAGSLVGTWGTKVTTAAEFTLPIVGAAAANIQVALRLDVREEAGKLSADVAICQLSTESPSFKVDYTKLLQYLKNEVSIPSASFAAGEKLALPDLVFTAGLDGAAKAVDTDGDTKPGVTMPATALGALAINAYVGLTMTIKLDATVKDADTIAGAGSFGVVGTIFGSNFPLLSSGVINITQKTPAPFTAKRFDGSLSCAELLPKL